jgi:hypothetical protein
MKYTGIKKKTEIKRDWTKNTILGMLKLEIDNCKIFEFPYDKKNHIRKYQILLQEQNNDLE